MISFDYSLVYSWYIDSVTFKVLAYMAIDGTHFQGTKFSQVSWTIRGNRGLSLLGINSLPQMKLLED